VAAGGAKIRKALVKPASKKLASNKLRIAQDTSEKRCVSLDAVTLFSAIARRSRAIAYVRSRPQAMSFPSKGSYSVGTAKPS